MIGPLFHKKAATSGGNSPLDGYKVVSGIIYLYDDSGTNRWAVLDDGSHTAINIDSVSDDGNGTLTIDYTSAGITKVVGSWIGGGGQLFKDNIQYECSMGLTEALIDFYIIREYAQDYYCTYNSTGGTWSIVKASTRQSDQTTPTIASWDAINAVLTVNHGTFGLPCTMALPYPATGAVKPFMLMNASNGWSNTQTAFRLIDPITGGPYAPANNDRIYFKRMSKRFTAPVSGAVNARSSPTNQLTNTFESVRLSSFQDLDDSGGGSFNNFQFLLIGQ